jgi:hypothetical protein
MEGKESKQTSSEKPKEEKKIIYKVTFFTGDVKGAGTDANVFLYLFGDVLFYRYYLLM